MAERKPKVFTHTATCGDKLRDNMVKLSWLLDNGPAVADDGKPLRECDFADYQCEFIRVAPAEGSGVVLVSPGTYLVPYADPEGTVHAVPCASTDKALYRATRSAPLYLFAAESMEEIGKWLAPDMGDAMAAANEYAASGRSAKNVGKLAALISRLKGMGMSDHVAHTIGHHAHGSHPSGPLPSLLERFKTGDLQINVTFMRQTDSVQCSLDLAPCSESESDPDSDDNDDDLKVEDEDEGKDDDGDDDDDDGAPAAAEGAAEAENEEEEDEESDDDDDAI